MTSDDDFQHKLQLLNDLFASRLQERFAILDQAMQLCLDDVSQREPLDELHRLLHSLAGSAGTFGFEALGLRAREIERRIVALIANGERTRDELVAVAAELAALKTSAPAA